MIGEVLRRRGDTRRADEQPDAREDAGHRFSNTKVLARPRDPKR